MRNSFHAILRSKSLKAFLAFLTGNRSSELTSGTSHNDSKPLWSPNANHDNSRKPMSITLAGFSNFIRPSVKIPKQADLSRLLPLWRDRAAHLRVIHRELSSMTHQVLEICEPGLFNSVCWLITSWNPEFDPIDNSWTIPWQTANAKLRRFANLICLIWLACELSRKIPKPVTQPWSHFVCHSTGQEHDISVSRPTDPKGHGTTFQQQSNWILIRKRVLWGCKRAGSCLWTTWTEKPTSNWESLELLKPIEMKPMRSLTFIVFLLPRA
jgi:hypothetical protein